MENLYDILKISKDANKSDIKKAYFNLIKLHSPEKDPERFKLIRHAYEFLIDDKQRNDYDNIIDVPEEYANDFIRAREYIDGSEYKQAINILEKLNKKYKNEPKIKKSLGEAYGRAGNSTKAIKIFESLTRDNPNDDEAALGLVKSYKLRGFINKAKLEYERFLDENPNNAKVWLEYIYFCKSNLDSNLLELFESAEQIDEDMFSNDYIIYSFAIFDSILKRKINTAIKYHEKFVKNYIADEKIDADKFEMALYISFVLLEGNYFKESIGKLVPYLEKFEFKTDDQIKQLEDINKKLSNIYFFDDDAIEDTFKDLTNILLDDCDCEHCMLQKFICEFDIVMEISSYRKSLIYMKNNYPEMYKLHQNFYNEVLFKNKGTYLLDKYMKKYENLEKKYPDFFDSYGEDEEAYDKYDDEYEEDEPVEKRVIPFNRPEPKIGRNQPCPCGSGKKYKNCCGKT